MKDNLEFKPTKRWIREHKYRPEGCPDKECYCSVYDFNKHGYGFCTGIKLNNKGDLDIISFCNTTFSVELPEEERRYLWHPNEALWIATCLNCAVISAWAIMPTHRKQLGYLNRQRTRLLNKLNRNQQQKEAQNGDNDSTTQ